MKQPKPIVELWELQQYGVMAIIVKKPTGILYSTQTGGISCNHPAVEGFVGKIIAHYDCGDAALPCCELIDPDKVNAEFRRLELPIEVDTACLSDSEEAWIHVNIIAGPFKGERGVLIYENCD